MWSVEGGKLLGSKLWYKKIPPTPQGAEGKSMEVWQLVPVICMVIHVNYTPHDAIDKFMEGWVDYCKGLILCNNCHDGASSFSGRDKLLSAFDISSVLRAIFPEVSLTMHYKGSLF